MVELWRMITPRRLALADFRPVRRCGLKGGGPSRSYDAESQPLDVLFTRVPASLAGTLRPKG